MMFFDIDDIIKRVLQVGAILLITGAIGFTTWYNFNLKNEFVEHQTETNILRQETSRLGANTDNLRDEFGDRTKELKQNISLAKEDNITLNNEFKNSQAENLKLINDLRGEISKLVILNDQLQDLIKTKDKEFKLQLHERDEKFYIEIAKLKDINIIFNAMHRQRDKELEELNSKINREIEWRNRHYYNR